MLSFPFFLGHFFTSLIVFFVFQVATIYRRRCFYECYRYFWSELTKATEFFYKFWFVHRGYTIFLFPRSLVSIFTEFMHRLYLSRLHPKIVSWYNRTAINDRCRCVEIRSHSKICKTSIQEFNVCNWIYGQFANFEEHASQAKPSWKPGEFTRWYELYLYKLNNVDLV